MEPEPSTSGPADPAAPAVDAASIPLMTRNFLLLWIGQTASQLGNQAFSIAMMFWTMEATGSASLMGLLMTFSTLPGVLLGPFGGTYADRHSRLRIVVVSDILAGLGVILVAAMLWLQPGNIRLITGVLFTVAILLGAIRAYFLPAVAAVIPSLVHKERLAAANSLNQLSVQGSILAGQALGGVLYNLLGAPLLFLLDGLSYLFSGLCASFIPRDPAPRNEAAAAEVHPFREFLRETREGLRYLLREKGMRDFTLIASLNNFLSMPGLVLFPFYVNLYLKEGPEWYGFLMAAVSAGQVSGFILAGVLRASGPARAAIILAAVIAYPVFFGSLALIRVPWLAAVAVFLGGLSVGLINVYLFTMIQRSTPSEMLGRVMGLLQTLSMGLMPIGMALGGVVGDLTGKNVPLVLGVSAGLALLISIVLGSRRTCREFLANG